jgi:hypothetical protein
MAEHGWVGDGLERAESLSKSPIPRRVLALAGIGELLLPWHDKEAKQAFAEMPSDTLKELVNGLFGFDGRSRFG